MEYFGENIPPHYQSKKYTLKQLWEATVLNEISQQWKGIGSKGNFPHTEGSGYTAQVLGEAI